MTSTATNPDLDTLVGVITRYTDAESDLTLATETLTGALDRVEETMTAACVAIAVSKETTPLMRIIDYVTSHGGALSKGTFPNFEAVGRIMRKAGDLPEGWIVRKHPESVRAFVRKGTVEGVTSLYSVVSIVEHDHGKAALNKIIGSAPDKATVISRLRVKLGEKPTTKAAAKAASKLVALPATGPIPALQEELARAVSDAMVHRGWNQALVADRADVSPKHVSGLLGGTAVGSLEVWSRLCEVTEVELWAVITLPNGTKRRASSYLVAM